jgi:poly(A) polymerase
VRDALLRRAVKDIDIATPDRPEEVIRLLERAGIKVVPTGIDHGTVTAVIGHDHFEVTSLRRDVETFGRHARVAFVDDWQADAARRDLTINAIFCAPDGVLFDPFGGRGDLAAGRIRFVGDAALRISEDYLRLLRFFRFFAHLGKPPPDAEALAACAQLAPNLRTLSGERLCGETLKLLAAPDPLPALALMIEHGVLPWLLPEARGLDRLQRLIALEDRRGERDSIRRLAALVAEHPLVVAERLRLSNAQRGRLAALCEPPLVVDVALDPQARRRALHRYGRDLVRDLALLAWAAGEAPPADAAWRALLAEIDAWQDVAFPIAGRDVVALGVARGKAVGSLLAAVEAWWQDGDYSADRAACLRELERRVAAWRSAKHGKGEGASS